MQAEARDDPPFSVKTATLRAWGSLCLNTDSLLGRGRGDSGKWNPLAFEAMSGTREGHAFSHTVVTNYILNYMV